MWNIYYYDLRTWRVIEVIRDEAEAMSRATAYVGREPYLRVVPAGSGIDDYLRCQ
jgi:hypothetical protein